MRVLTLGLCALAVFAGNRRCQNKTAYHRVATMKTTGHNIDGEASAGDAENSLDVLELSREVQLTLTSL